MLLTLTDQGIAALNNCSSPGSLVRVNTIKLGDYATPYTPVSSQTALYGTVVYTSNIDSCQVLATNTIEFIETLDESVGNFQFREIGLYTDTGVLFAIGVSPAATQYQKIKQDLASNVLGNRYIIRAQIQYTNVVNCLDFTLLEKIQGNEWAEAWMSATCIAASPDFRVLENNADFRITESGDSRIVDLGSYSGPCVCIRVQGDQTSIFHNGRRVRLSLSSGVVYNFVKSSTYDAGSDTTCIYLYIQNVDATVGSIDYGVMSSTHSGKSSHPSFGLESQKNLIADDCVIPPDHTALSFNDTMSIDPGVTVAVEPTGVWKIGV